MRFFTILALILFAAGAAFADDSLTYTPPPAPEMPNPAALLTRLLLVTGAALAVCFGVLWLARRAQRGPAGKGDPTGRLQLEGSLGVDRRSAVHLLRVDGNTTVAVATDVSGLRSLTLLSESFESTLAAASTRLQATKPTAIGG